MPLSLDTFYVSLAIFARMMGLFFFVPFFSSALIPARVRIIFLIAVTILLAGANSESISVPDDLSTGKFAAFLVLEFLTGTVLAFMVDALLTAFQLAGQLVSVQIGFGINEVIDPMSQISIPLIGQFQALLGMFLFIVLDGPGMVLEGLAASFSYLPPFTSTPFFESPGVLLKAVGLMFVVALKIAFPILGTLFLSTVALGLMAKASPQMNVFMLGFPVNISLGLIVFLLSLPSIFYLMESVITGIPGTLNDVMKVLSGGGGK